MEKIYFKTTYKPTKTENLLKSKLENNKLGQIEMCDFGAYLERKSNSKAGITYQRFLPNNFNITPKKLNELKKEISIFEVIGSNKEIINRPYIKLEKGKVSEFSFAEEKDYLRSKYFVNLFCSTGKLKLKFNECKLLESYNFKRLNEKSKINYLEGFIQEKIFDTNLEEIIGNFVFASKNS